MRANHHAVDAFPARYTALASDLMDISLESFHVDGAKCGALVRRRTPREVSTLICFRTGGELYRATSRLEHDGSPLDWTLYTFEDVNGALDLTREAPGRVIVNGEARDVPADTVPSYAGPAILEDMLATSATEIEFHLLSEAEPTAEPQPAHYSVGNPEATDAPHDVPGDPDPAEHGEPLGVAELFVADRPSQKFWFDSHRIIASDWDGARSFATDTVDELTEGLDADIVDAVRAFCG